MKKRRFSRIALLLIMIFAFSNVMCSVNADLSVNPVVSVSGDASSDASSNASSNASQDASADASGEVSYDANPIILEKVTANYGTYYLYLQDKNGSYYEDEEDIPYFEIYYSTSKNGTYQEINMNYYFDNYFWDDDYDYIQGVYVSGLSLPYGTTCYFYVKAYTTIDDVDYPCNPTAIKYVKIKGDSIWGVTATPVNYNTIKVTWYQDSNYTGYIVKRSTSKKGTYETVAVVKSNSKLKYKDTGLDCGVTYYYKVFGYNVINGKKVIASASPYVCSAKTSLSEATLSHKALSPTKMKLTWSKIEGAEGYNIYVMYPNSKKYVLKKTVKAGKTLAVNLSVKNGSVYGIRVRGYVTVNGVKKEGAGETNYFAGDYYSLANETTAQKNARLKGCKKQVWIKVRVWDFVSGMKGKKYTKYINLQVNKNLAPLYRVIFDEIYRNSKKCPISDAGCYRIKGQATDKSEHYNGTAVDLNYMYNPMMDNGKVSVGYKWDPKKYAYSIPLNGVIQKTFEKYGFKRGFWRTRKDYMHFSYFGT